MTQITINHADGSKTPLFSKQNISAVSKATQKISLLSEDVVNITVNTAHPLDLRIGDTAMIYGKKYKLNQLPQPTKNSERNYTYELTLEGPQYDLIDVRYHLPENCYGDTLYADLGGHLDVLMWNIKRVFPGVWELGEYPEGTKYTNFTSSEKNCLAALQEHCTNYGVEFEITSDGRTNTINIKARAGRTHGFTVRKGARPVPDKPYQRQQRRHNEPPFRLRRDGEPGPELRPYEIVPSRYQTPHLLSGRQGIHSHLRHQREREELRRHQTAARRHRYGRWSGRTYFHRRHDVRP